MYVRYGSGELEWLLLSDPSPTLLACALSFCVLYSGGAPCGDHAHQVVRAGPGGSVLAAMRSSVDGSIWHVCGV